METILPATADDSSGANPSSVKSDDSSPRHESGCGSPPPNCAICLGTCRNKSFTDSCLHQFCFKCLLTWSKVKAECPLCKQIFKSIIHNVRSNHQYDEYTVEQRHEETTQSIDIDNMASFTRRFRYRTTLTLPRRESLAIQQLLMHYPLVADVFPPPAPPAPPAAPPRRRSPASFRRTVYRHNLWARPLPDFTGRFRDCSPDFYRANDSQMHRLMPWLSRELHYLLNENPGHISYVMTRILELLPTHHINSPEFREAMQRYFGERTEHFLHELYCFAITPYDITGYDRNVQYTTDSRISTMVNEVISSSDSEASVDSDIVMVSHSEPAEAPPGPSRAPPAYPPPRYLPPPPADRVIPIETVSQSDTDDDSSEVMVVGYIKPPQDRTPEVVDLLGSDSDVIVHDGAPPEPARGPVVKLSLKRHTAREVAKSESEDSEYRPPPRRARRPRSPAAGPAPDRAWSPAASSSPPSDGSDTCSSSSGSYDRRKKLTKKKSKRKRKESVERDRKKSKKARSSRKDERFSSKTESRDRRSKKKSQSGKGVKSSKKSAQAPPEPAATPPPATATTLPATATTPPAAATPPPAAATPPPAPGPSGAAPRPSRDRKRRRTSHENKRLKSVVNVMYKSSSDASPSSSNTPTSSIVTASSSGGSCPPDCRYKKRNEHLASSESTSSAPIDDQTDSDEDLPLNLSLHKKSHHFPAL